MKKRTAILISGRGSNMRALIQAAKADDYPAEIVLVLSNKADAVGLAFAREHGIETAVISHKDFDGREAFDAAMDALLREKQIEIVCLAGFMRLLTPAFTQRWEGRMINIHPSLLPKYKGLDTHRRALEAGEQEAGCTVHYVSAEMDAGEIIMQSRVPILEDDSEETLAARVLEQEHIIYPQALASVIARSEPSE